MNGSGFIEMLARQMTADLQVRWIDRPSRRHYRIGLQYTL